MDFAAIHINMFTIINYYNYFTMVVVGLSHFNWGVSELAAVEVHASQICFFRELVVHWKEWSKEFAGFIARVRASQICFFRVAVEDLK